MRKWSILAAAGLAATLWSVQASAATLFTDGFEGYNLGVLDKNENLATDNDAPIAASPADMTNPWFGPCGTAVGNGLVVTSDVGAKGETVTPHSGNQMVMAANDWDENWVNVAYHFNNGSAFTGGITYDWWFYDSLGAGGATLKDYGALGYYALAANGVEYPVSTDRKYNGNLNKGAVSQRVSFGTYSGTGFDTNYYQARIVTAKDGISGGTWFNTTGARSVGWHEFRIVASDALTDGTCDLSFYMDDMANPVFTHNSLTACGFNVIEMNTGMTGTTAYFDDITFSTNESAPVPEPGSLMALGAGALSLIGIARRRMVK